MAGDASSVQLDKIRTTLYDRTIPQAVLGDRNTLGAAVGLAPLSAVAVTNRSLADKLVAELKSSGDESGTDAVEA
jgi:ribosomal protein L7Ae-like RNA K-turn-binding protein|tara:strand:- start:115 stop:339 length:225 start_codon:yes stop_codon:yes gene_type:complete